MRLRRTQLMPALAQEQLNEKVGEKERERRKITEEGKKGKERGVGTAPWRQDKRQANTLLHPVT